MGGANRHLASSRWRLKAWRLLPLGQVGLLERATPERHVATGISPVARAESMCLGETQPTCESLSQATSMPWMLMVVSCCISEPVEDSQISMVGPEKHRRDGVQSLKPLRPRSRAPTCW